ncbi:testis-expressed sequence 2 protein-like, partial [Clarias magur]
MEDNELFQDPDEEDPTISFSKEKPCGRGSNRPDLHSSAFSFPLSSSTPSSLGELSSSSHDTTAAPSTRSCIIKSSSAFSDKDSKESALLRPNPMPSLVESLSMEISHRESEFCLSNSDSKLHLQPWKQLGQLPKLKDAELLPRTMPSSPTESRPSRICSGSLLMAELEDTRRKLSEAMQEPLIKLSKIIGEDSGSPKSQKGDLSALQGGAAGGILIRSEDGAGEWNKENGSPFGICETPLRKPKRELAPSITSEICCKLGSKSSRYEICTYGDVIQVLEIQEHSGKTQVKPGEQNGVKAPPARYTTSSDMGRWLVCVGLLAYCCFVLPLSSYVTGLFLGLACGFMLGLAVVLMLAPQRSAAREMPISSPSDSLLIEHMDTILRDPAKTDLQGWMNEMYSYDPETYHPSLCHSVHVTLDGCHLRLAYPPVNIPRQATFNEPVYETTFVRSRCFKLSNSKVFLLPAILAKKRVWNRKYPICIMLAEEEQCIEEEQFGEIAEVKSEREVKLKQVQKEADQITTLYLFGRTGREKEEWYQHFLSASNIKVCRDESKPGVCSAGGSPQASNDDLASMLGLRELAGSVREKILLDYNSYMAHFITPESCSLTPSPCHSEPGSPINTKKFSSDPVAGCRDPAWINAVIGRIFWDFLLEEYWSDQVAHKIQKKLSKIRLPYFMNELTLAELDLGTCMPQVLSISRPSVDHRGLWLELEVLYTGSLHMTLETKMNLCKLGRESCSEVYSTTEPSRIVGTRPRVCIIADSDEESSSAGSSDEEEMMPSELVGPMADKNIHSGAEGHGGGSTSRKILRFVDKIAKSKYFQKATENEYIKKKIAEVSNTPMLLSVEVLELSGTLAVNIPPPPTDRIWYSFRVPPRLDLRVKPMLGEREVTFTHVTEWIERKLQCEFQ